MTEAEVPWRVLVVDDDEIDREAVRRSLRRAGLAVDVVEATSGQEALGVLETQSFDCVFLDYNLPGANGLTLLPTIRQAGQDVPVVVLTGHGDEHVAVLLMKAGAADYVPKSSATPERLASTLRYAIEVARAQAQARAADRELLASARRSRFLAEASAILARSLDMRATLERVARLSVPILGDYCLIYLAEEHGPTAIASAHRDPAKERFTRMVEEGSSMPSDHPTSGVAEVMRTARVKLVAEITQAHIDAIASTDEEREAYRVLAPRSALFVPFVARSTLGAAVFCRDADGGDFSIDDIALAEDLGSRVATALENARLFLERAELYDAERAARAEAEKARRDAEEANRVKSEFLARMSHDLRTPLNAIAGYAQLIEEGIYGDPTPGQRESLGRIRRAQQHLLTLINDVLSFARLEAGQVHLRVESVDLHSAFDALTSLVEPQTAAKDLSLTVQNAPASLTVTADRERLVQILLNLLTNAVKFTEPGGRIAVAAEPSGLDSVAITVSDTGPGIPADRLETIFDPFVQAGSSATEERQGVGLGLAIGRELARMMNGQLTARSVVGEGSTFILTLPAGGTAEDAARDSALAAVELSSQ